MTKNNKPRSRGSFSETIEYKNYEPGPGLKKREYGLSKTAREKWIRAETDRVIEYLRVRRNFDQMDVLNPHEHYRSPFIRQCIKLLIKQGNGNYFGVQINRTRLYDGMVGDSIYNEFWYEYHTKGSLSEWLRSPKEFKKLFRKYKAMYKVRGEISESKRWIYQRIVQIYNGMTIDRSRKKGGGSTEGERDIDEDPFLYYKDHQYLAREKIAKKHFRWTSKSHKRTKRKAKRDAERDKSKTRQSLLALESLCKYNWLVDERFNIQVMSNHKDHKHEDKIYIWDHELQREHIYLRVGSNDMRDHKSIWYGAMGAIDHIRHFQYQVSTGKKDKMPTLMPFKLNDFYWDYKYELDAKGGGYVDVGAHNRDSVPAEGYGEKIMIMRGEYVLTTASVTYLFGMGDNERGGKVLSLLMAWAHHMKHLYNFTGGKHYTNPEGEKLSPEEREELYHELMED